jgi:hypothetical protein
VLLINLPGFPYLLCLREGPGGGVHPDVLGQIIPLKHLFTLDLDNLAVGHVGLEVEHLEALLLPITLIQRGSHHVLSYGRTGHRQR